MRLVSLFVIFLLIACTERDPDPPLTQKKFKTVYNEIMILESYYQMNFRNLNIYKDSLRKSVDGVLEAHNVTFEEFEKTYNYYSKHQENFQDINNDLIESYSK
ncbi:MAG: DUF4296 domain-containing protein [Crocinitomicaceae bacterium]|nr:DUF4296 domain-containing protein [Crocinitomicaceae bacterium]MDG1736249.1 DUF4296 domain-containing protein [Crocinitomicaceae bacterium]MDG2504836.1 DUF4296 domain-containing protein [Crocinitomicaceae bacterium]